MDLHQRFVSLNEELLTLQKEVFRAIRISHTRFAICFYDRHEQTMRTNVIDSRTAHELKLLAELSGAELVAYGKFVADIQMWCDSESPGEFPIAVVESDEASYRTLIDAMTSAG